MATERMDEFEVEVTPVRDDWEAVTDGVEGEPPVSARAPEPPFACVAAWSVRWRRLVTSLAAGALLLAMLAVLVARLPSLFGDDLPPRPILPTATRDPDDRVFYALGTVPWGMLRADGIVVPLAGAMRLPPSFRLPDGRHTLEYAAPPLPTLRCVVTVPAGPGESCPMMRDRQHLPGDASIPGASNVLDLQAAPARLPPDVRAALERAIASALDDAEPIHTSVASGERYAAPGGGIATAAQSLTATLRAQLAPAGTSDVPPLSLGPSRATASGAPCLDICTDIPLEGQYADRWPLDVSVALAWQYADPMDGRVIATVPFDFPVAHPAGAGDARFTIRMLAAWDGSDWQVAPADPAPTGGGQCAFAQAIVAQLYAALPTTSGGTGSTGKVDPTTNPADGCVVSYQRAVDATNAEPQGVFFFRLGLLLAANDQAHTLFPALPVADARDKALMVTPTP